MDQGLLTTLGRRSAQRICVRTDVGILDETSGVRLLGQLRDLSGSGACLSTQAPLPIGKELRLAFEFEKGEEPVRLHVEVAWSGHGETTRGNTLSGVRFLDLAGADFGRLRDFIDRKLWQVQHFLCSIDALSDLNDLEKLLLASVAFDRELANGEALEESVSENSLVMVRLGTLQCQERLTDGRQTARRVIASGELGGALPIDPRGGCQLILKAVSQAAVLVIPADGFWYLWGKHPETALKLLACWSLALRDRLFAVEAVEPVQPTR